MIAVQFLLTNAKTKMILAIGEYVLVGANKNSNKRD